jgi:hypothetical protein
MNMSAGLPAAGSSPKIVFDVPHSARIAEPARTVVLR